MTGISESIAFHRIGIKTRTRSAGTCMWLAGVNSKKVLADRERLHILGHGAGMATANIEGWSGDWNDFSAGAAF